MPRAIRVLQRSTIYKGKVIQLIREVLEILGHRIVRETVRHPGAVVIVPVLDHSRIIFVRQYRRAIDRELLELPAGTLDPRERLDACARRELEEETGWRVRHLHKIAQFYAAPGFISEQLTVFLARDLTHTIARPEPDELLPPVIVSFSSALAKIRSGAICDAKTIIGVLFAQRYLNNSRVVSSFDGWGRAAAGPIK